MKLVLSVFLFFVFGIVSAQNSSESLKKTLQTFDKALIEKDSLTLEKLLHAKVSYGHSNGWVENKKDIFSNQRTGYLKYDKIESGEADIIVSKKWASVRTKTHAEGTVNGTGFNIDLNVLQVWIKTKKGWQIVARQAAKQQ
jgi:hypothetical protein